MRGAVLLLSATLLIVPAHGLASAPAEDLGEGLPDGDPALHDRETMLRTVLADGLGAEPSVAGVEAEQFLIHEPLGDADGDGFDDVLQIGYGSEAVGLAVRAGPGLERTVWTARVERVGTYVHRLPDADGDGIDEIVAKSLDYETTGEGAFRCAVAACAGASGTVGTKTTTLSVHSGATGSLLLDRSIETTYRYTSGGGVGPAASSFHRAINATWISVASAPGSKGLAVIEQRYTVASDYAYAAVAGTWSTAVLSADVAVETVSADGSTQARTVEDEPSVIESAVPIGDAVGDDHLDLALRRVEAAPPGSALAFAAVAVVDSPMVSHTEVAMLDGSDLSREWLADREPGAGTSTPVRRIGDVDGDGGADLSFAEGVHAPAHQGQTLTLASDGSTIGSTSRAGLYPARFGDVDGDGDDEILTGGFWELAVRQGDLSEVWSVELDGVPHFHARQGPGDWSGDGAPDVLTVADETIRLRSGVDGSVLWNASEPNGTRDVDPVRDVDGVGTRDLALVHVEDEGNASIQLDVVAGGSGDRIWRRPVAPASWLANRSLDEVHAVLRDIGDVDGDGATDVLVAIEDLEDDEALDVVVSGADGDVLWSQPDVPSLRTGDGDEATPVVADPRKEKVEDPDRRETDGAGNASGPGGTVPGASAISVIVGLAVALLVERRR